MDLLIVALLLVVFVVLALRGRGRGKKSAPTASPRGGWSFSRHPREDWRYWRDLAILISLGLGLLLTMVVLAGLGKL